MITATATTTTTTTKRDDANEWVGASQRGSFRGRDALANVVEFDGAGRVAALLAQPPRDGPAEDDDSASPLPPGILWDFAAAFPSISRRYLRAVLRTMQLPRPAPSGACMRPSSAARPST